MLKYGRNQTKREDSLGKREGKVSVEFKLLDSDGSQMAQNKGCADTGEGGKGLRITENSSKVIIMQL